MNKLFHFFFLSVAVLVLCVTFGLPAQAHTLAVDGTVGAVLHTDPNDEPVAGGPSTLIFAFKDSTKEFDPAAYHLTLSIAGAGTSTSSPLIFTATTSASFPYVFPAPGIYTATVQGASTGSATPFSLTYQIRVTPATGSSQSAIGTFFGVHGAHVLLTAILVLVLVAVIGQEKYKERKAHRTNKL